MTADENIDSTHLTLYDLSFVNNTWKDYITSM
jgi:hypothetical protein